MKRRKAELPPADAIRALADDQRRLAIRVTPGAREERLEIVEGRLFAKVRAIPEGGRANEAVLALLAGALDLAVSRLSLLRGATSREKLVQLPE